MLSKSLLSMEQSYELMLRLLSQGVTSHKKLLAYGVRHQTIKNWRFAMLKEKRKFRHIFEELKPPRYRLAQDDTTDNIVAGCTLSECIGGLNRWK